MGILHIVQYSLPEIASGYTIRTEAIVREQRAAGLDAVVLTSPRHPGPREEEIQGVMHYRCRQERAARSVWLRDAARVRALTRRIEAIARSRGDLRLLHAHSPVMCGLAALRAGRRIGLPVVYETRGLWEEAMRGRGPRWLWWPRYRLGQMMETKVCRAAGAVVTLSQGLRREFAARGVDQAKIHVVPNGVDPWMFSPRTSLGSWREKHGLGPGPLLLYLGALRAYEGLDLLLDAFPGVRRSHPAAQLAIVGQGEHHDHIAARVEAGGDGISLLPPVPHAATPEFYAAAELVVYPRLSDRVTELVAPLKPLEAMAVGKAVVASDVGGLRELLTDGETARLFPAGSAGALAAVCSELLADDEQRRRLGESARRVACERFDWRVVVSGYGEAYRAVGYT